MDRCLPIFDKHPKEVHERGTFRSATDLRNAWWLSLDFDALYSKIYIIFYWRLFILFQLSHRYAQILFFQPGSCRCSYHFNWQSPPTLYRLLSFLFEIFYFLSTWAQNLTQQHGITNTWWKKNRFRKTLPQRRIITRFNWQNIMLSANFLCQKGTVSFICYWK